MKFIASQGTPIKGDYMELRIYQTLCCMYNTGFNIKAFRHFEPNPGEHAWEATNLSHSEYYQKSTRLKIICIFWRSPAYRRPLALNLISLSLRANAQPLSMRHNSHFVCSSIPAFCFCAFVSRLRIGQLVCSFFLLSWLLPPDRNYLLLFEYYLFLWLFFSFTARLFSF